VTTATGVEDVRGVVAALLCGALVLAACDGGDDVEGSPVDVLGDDEVVGDDLDAVPEDVEEPPGPDEVEVTDDEDAADADDEGDDPAGTDDAPDPDEDAAADAAADGPAVDEPVDDADAIDEAYVARVVTAIDEVMVALVTDVQEADGWTDSAQVTIDALYADGSEEANAAAWEEIVELGFVAEPPEAGEARVVALVSASTDCIAVHADRFTGDFFLEDSPFPPEPTYLLGLRQAPELAGSANPTVWEIHAEGVVDEEDVFDVCDEPEGADVDG
jgi:hypothetical protein